MGQCRAPSSRHFAGSAVHGARSSSSLALRRSATRIASSPVILNGDPVEDGPTAEFQVVHEIPAPSRIDDRARPADRRHPMPNLSGKLDRAQVPASTRRSNRRAAGLPLQISISSSARRSAPRASRFLVLRVFFDVISQRGGIAVWMGRTLIRRSRSRNSSDRGRLARRDSGQGKVR